MSIHSAITTKKPPSSLWIIKPGSLGDIVHALPCASAIRSHWPNTHITWVVDPRWDPLLKDNPAIDARILFRRQDFSGFGGLFRVIQWIFSLKDKDRPDICLDLQGLLRSALISRFSRASCVIGFSNAREFAPLLYHHSISTENVHAVDRYLTILSALGIKHPTTPEFPLPLGTAPQEGVPPSPYWILLHPFARGEGKSLSEAAVLRFCERFTLLPIVVAGMGKLSLPLPSHCSVLLNRISLEEMIWLCRNAHFTVSVDSGPAHIAVAAHSSRVLCLHTWSDPRKVGPYSSESWIWQGGKIRRQNLLPTAPLLPSRQLDLSDIDDITLWLTKHLSTNGLR